METDAADPSSSDEKGKITSYTITPGSFQMIPFTPDLSLSLGTYNFFDQQPLSLPPLPAPPPHGRSQEDETFRSKIMRCRRLPMMKKGALYHKYNSLANERKIRFAASTCNVELLCEMLERGTNPNCCDEHKRSPLHLAACRGYGDIITMLLQHGANPNILDSLGNTPLHLSVISASSRKFNNVVRILLNHGASVHVTDRTGRLFYLVFAFSLRFFLRRKIRKSFIKHYFLEIKI